jgi:hypothetical protein
VVHRTVSGAPGWYPSTSCSRDFVGGVRLKFTGLSGGAPDCLVSQQSVGPTVGRGIRARRVASANGQMGHRSVRCAPECPVCTGVSGVHRSVRCAPDSVRCAPECLVCTGVSGVHWSVRCANGSKAPTVGFTKYRKRSASDIVRCARRQKARIAFLECTQRLLAALGL